MYITVVNEDLTDSNIAKLFIKNVEITVNYKFSEGAKGINQVLICKNINNLNSTPRTNYGKLGSLQFNLTRNGVLIPAERRSKDNTKLSSKLTWAYLDSGVIRDVEGDYYEVLRVNFNPESSDQFRGRIELRPTKNANIESTSQGSTYSGSNMYVFEVRDFNPAIDR